MHNPINNQSERNPLKVINLIDHNCKNNHEPIHRLIEKRLHTGTPFFAIEVSPFTNPNAAELNLNDFVHHKSGLPLFASITWMAPDNVLTEPIDDAPAIKLAQTIRSVPTLLHITCGGLTENVLQQILSTADNVMALKGDFVSPTQPMQHASDLIRSIRQQRSDISIAVAAYPEVHPDAKSAADDLQSLVEKIACGANIIITQFCFSPTIIIDFINKCRSVGITVPILVGIFIPATYASLLAMCRICGVRMKDDDLEEYRRLAGDAAGFQETSLRNAKAMLRTLIDNGVVGFQFFTLNRFDLVLECLQGTI